MERAAKCGPTEPPMVDASEIAFLTVVPASDKAWAVSGELVAATGGAAIRIRNY